MHSQGAILQAFLSEKGDELVADLIKDNKIEWECLFSLSGDNLVTPGIARKILSGDLTDRIAPEVCDALRVILAGNQERNRMLLSSFYRLASDLNCRNISPLPLKGINLLLTGLYQDVGDRVVSDIDILIPHNKLKPALLTLQNLGYVQRSNPFFSRNGPNSRDYAPIDPADFRNQPSNLSHHLPEVMFDSKALVNIEIHIYPCSQKTMTGVALHNLAWQSTSIHWSNASSYCRPTDEFTLLHTMHHMYIQDRLFEQGLIDYRHLQDCTLLLNRIESQDSGERLLATVQGTEFHRWLEFLLHQCRHVLGHEAVIKPAPSADGTRLIRTFDQIRSSPGHRARYKLQRFFQNSLPRVLNGEAVSEAFGTKVSTKTLFLYSRYQYNRLRHHLSRDSKP